MQNILEMLCERYKALGKKLKMETRQDVIWQALARQGLWKIPVPLWEGGLGLNWTDWLMVVEKLEEQLLSTSFYEKLAQHAGSLRSVVYYADSNEKPILLRHLFQGKKVLTKTSNISIKRSSDIFECTLYCLLGAQYTIPSFQKARAIFENDVLLRKNCFVTEAKIQFANSQLKELLKAFEVIPVDKIENSGMIFSQVHTMH